LVAFNNSLKPQHEEEWQMPWIPKVFKNEQSLHRVDGLKEEQIEEKA
jgi:hypothetical protein